VTNDPASAPPRPSTPPQQQTQQQQPIPSQHQQQQEQRPEQRQEQRREEPRDERRDDRREERNERRDERREERNDQRHEDRNEQRPIARLEDEWQAVQYEFVDDPKAAVRKADALVTRAIEELTTRHRSLAKQLEGNGDPQTEDLRLALHRYRELFKSLVAVK
jgi:hypothetical protein